MNVKQHDVWPGKQASILCRIHGPSRAGNKGWCGGNTERGDKGMLRGQRCKCHFVLFNTSRNVAVDIQDVTAAVIS